jgi:hypothetical protein
MAPEPFTPYAVILTERSRPTQVTLAVLLNVPKLLIIPLDASKPRTTFIHQALREMRKRLARFETTDIIPFFGKVTGIVVNYGQNRAVRFDVSGQAIELLPHAVQACDGLLNISSPASV